MALVIHVEGVQGLVKNMQRLHPELGNRMAVGLKRAGSFIQRESQKIVPVDTGNLKRSAFTRSFGQSWSTQVYVGYTQSYAIYVHENLEARHKPGKVAKYLEAPIREHKGHILTVIKDALRLGSSDWTRFGHGGKK